MKRNVYLNTVDLTEIEHVLDQVLRDIKYSPSPEIIPVTDSVHRITYNAVFAKTSSPCYNASAMDGIALDAFETYEATESTPVTIKKENFSYINTGNEIPAAYNTVIMIEDVYLQEDGSIVLYQSAKQFQHIRPIGEDIVEGDLILPRNHDIRPIDLSVLLSAGITELEVLQKPTIAIIPTGDEIVSNVSEIQPGKIIDSNSHYLKNELNLLGTSPTILPIQKDNYADLEQTILQAVKDYDIVLIGAGSSAGSKDYAKSIIEENGTVYVHGISIKPGKPTIIGTIFNTPIVGVPGYPVSTYISFEEVIRNLVLKCLHQHKNTRQTIQAKLTTKVYSSLKHKEFIRVKLGYIGNEYVATPLSRGAGVSMSLVQADGLLLIEKNNEGYETNTYVDIILLKDVSEIHKSLVVIGSHDILLDKINDLMTINDYHLSSSHVGSFSGVLAIKNRGCHIAPVHILHPDGSYNKFLLDKYLNDDYLLIRGVNRIQGLYVKEGNPKQITSLQDIRRPEVTFVNRQRGSGTRMLLDYLLEKENINPDEINGYEYELSTHTLVASGVKDDRFDVGLGIMSVAKMKQLEFIPLGHEHYDFIVLKEIVDTPVFTEFVRVLQSTEFQKQLEELGGYTIDKIGEIV